MKVKVLFSTVFSRGDLFNTVEAPSKKIAMTTARMVVARVESTFLRPILPRMATAAAKTADKRAYKIQVILIKFYHNLVLNRKRGPSHDGDRPL